MGLNIVQSSANAPFSDLMMERKLLTIMILPEEIMQ